MSGMVIKTGAIRNSLRGVAFTIDALVATFLLFITMTLFMFFLLNPLAPSAAYDYGIGQNTMDALKGLTLSQLDGNPRYPKARDVIGNYSSWAYYPDGMLTPVAVGYSQGNGTSVVETIAGLWLDRHHSYAGNLSDDVLGEAVPRNYGIRLEIHSPGNDCAGQASNWSCIYNSPRGQASAFQTVGNHFVYYNGSTYGVRLVLHH